MREVVDYVLLGALALLIGSAALFVAGVFLHALGDLFPPGFFRNIWRGLRRAGSAVVDAVPGGMADTVRQDQEAVELRRAMPLPSVTENATRCIEPHRMCFYCGGTSWLEGPSGGLSTNIMCASCGQEVNYTPLIPRADPIGVNGMLRGAYHAAGRTVADRAHILNGQPPASPVAAQGPAQPCVLPLRGRRIDL